MALFGEERRPATAIATRQTRLLPLTRASLLERVQEDSGVALHLLKGLYDRIQHADRQVQRAVENNEVLLLALAKREEEPDAPSPDRAEQVSEQEVDAQVDVSIGELAALWNFDQRWVRRRLSAQWAALLGMSGACKSSVEKDGCRGQFRRGRDQPPDWTLSAGGRAAKAGSKAAALAGAQSVRL